MKLLTEGMKRMIEYVSPLVDSPSVKDAPRRPHPALARQRLQGHLSQIIGNVVPIVERAPCVRPFRFVGNLFAQPFHAAVQDVDFVLAQTKSIRQVKGLGGASADRLEGGDNAIGLQKMCHGIRAVAGQLHVELSAPSDFMEYVGPPPLSTA
jgi:hypothetical protein